MRTTIALGWLLLLLTTPACAAQAAADFQPEQLRDFARAELTVVRRDGRDSFRVWLAITPAEQQQGLMWIRRLPPDQGMLFLLESPRNMDMWMKNTFVPLDMLFFDAAGRITHILRNAKPHSEDFLNSGGTVAGVVEILAGEAIRRGIREGDRIILPQVRSR